MREQKKLTGVSLFAGAGGMDLGFEKAGVEVVWANELDKNAVKTYRKNFRNKIIEGDISEIKSEEIPETDIVFGGPPCQGFSVAGKMDPEDPRSKLIWEFHRVVKDKQPKVFVMENVKNMVVNTRFTEIKTKILESFEEIGYRTEVRVLNAKDFGVPQARERAIFIGVRKDLGIEANSLYPKEKEGEEKTVREVLMELHKSKPEMDRCNAKIVPAKNPIMRKSPYAGMLFNGQGRPLNLDRPSITLTASMGGNKTPIIDEMFLRKEHKMDWVEKYHERLQRGEDPVTEVPSYLRRITVKEAAVIQTFPEAYEFEGSQCSRYRQIGNAVPVKLAQEIAKQIKTKINQI